MGAAVGVASAVFGPESYTHALLSFELGSIAVTRGDYDIAIEQLQHAYAVLDRVAPGQRRANLAQVKLGWCLAQVGRYDEAIPMLEAAHTAQTNLLRPEHADVLYAALTLAEVRLGAGQTDGVEELLERSLVSARALRGPNSSIAGAMLVRLGMLAERRDDARLAERRYREALEILRPDPTMPPSYLEVLALLAQLVVQHREYPEALSLTEEMVRVGKRRYGDDATATLRIELIAARVYNDSGRGLEFVDRIARVQELLAEREVDPVFVARAQFEHAQALHASDARRAMQLARDAHATLVTRTGGANDAEAVAAWLAAHRRRN
jgi:tetratricopeptide (TPR) repeat protein